MTRTAPQPLPTTRREMTRRGWQQLDVLLISGDAYVDHPSFGVALLGRWLEHHGFRVGIAAQPRWDRTDDLQRMGRPRLFAGITAGALDSMLARYTAFRAPRRSDAYSPAGQVGLRPRRASVVYANLARQAFPGLPLVLGGVEASLRRITHYDFWSDALRRSVLLDAKADLLLYGMAERALLEVAQRLQRGDALDGIRGTVRATTLEAIPPGPCEDLPSHEAMELEPFALMQATLALERQVHQGTGWLRQVCGRRALLLAPPAPALTTEQLDLLYNLPFTRQPHGCGGQPVPAAEMIRHSVTTHRGCAGGCSFCSLALHQGRTIRSRSAASILREVQRITRAPGFSGSISDVGGPSANMWGARCAGEAAICARSSCLHPKPCRHFQSNQLELARLLRQLADLPDVRHLRVASGVRHDLALREPAYLRALAQHFTGGQLKLAPEHSSPEVLRLMRKPPVERFQQALELFRSASQQAGKEQYVVPYLMSAFPGCTDDQMRQLSRWLKRRGWRPQQVQCFVPTPGTVATAMYVSGRDPRGRPIHVARSDAERLRQHRLLTGGHTRR